MAVTRQQVERFLRADEPDYQAAARLGPGALPYLEQIAREGDTAMAAKAVYLASLIDGDGSSVVEAGANRADAAIRVVAASVLATMPSARMADIAVRLLDDPEPGVRRRALEGLPRKLNADLADRIQTLAVTLPEGAYKGQLLDAVRRKR